MATPTELELSRWQFALTAAFHMAFPAITVGLALFLCVTYGAWMRTRDPVYLQARGRLYVSRRFQRWVTWMTPVGLIAIISGWVLAETGRQPYVVYGKLVTSNSVSDLASGSLIFSLVAFVAVYVLLLAVWITYVVKQVRRGPLPEDLTPPGVHEAPDDHGPAPSTPPARPELPETSQTDDRERDLAGASGVG